MIITMAVVIRQFSTTKHMKRRRRRSRCCQGVLEGLFYEHYIDCMGGEESMKTCWDRPAKLGVSFLSASN
jgi:hypothetical protein